MSLSEKIVHRRVVSLSTLRESPDGLPVLRRKGWPVGRLRIVDAKAVAVASHAALDGLAQVLPEVKPVRDLYRVGGAETSSLRIRPGTVSAYNLHAIWLIAEPAPHP